MKPPDEPRTAMAQPTIKIASGQGDYEVVFHTTPAEAVGSLVAGASGVIADRSVLELYRDSFSPLLADVPTLSIDATESAKTLEGVGTVASWLLEQGINRGSRIVAIGGGVIQDVATFSAHVFHRGIRWDFAPTTLLSMTDSCIGAKCGINHDGFKNQLGVFQSPGEIAISTDFLITLDDSEVLSGYGEVFKLCLTDGPEAFALLADSLRDGLRSANLPELIRVSLETKKKIIESDEYESDLRRVLNYGHTFGHALEALSSGAIPHGTAVVWGCDLVNHLALSLGLLSEADYKAIHHVAKSLIPNGLTIPPVTANSLVKSAGTDKKAADGIVSLVVLRKPGDLEIVPVALDDALAELVSQYLKTDDLLASP